MTVKLSDYIKDTRPDIHYYFLVMARLASLRSSCVRRTVGCVLVNEHNHVLSTGYNGVLRFTEHCLSKPCDGAQDPSGSSARCEAIHAEANAVLHCDARHAVRTAYCTDLPCKGCAKQLVTACPGLRELWYVRDYPDREGITILRAQGITVFPHPTAYDKSVDEMIKKCERFRPAEEQPKA